MKKAAIVKIVMSVIFFSSFCIAVEIQVDLSKGRRAISPYIYGRNNDVSDDPSAPMSAATVTLYNDAGLRMTRDGGGNNSTKYNWRRKLTSHPDWYNNVYPHDWDFASQSIVQRLPQTCGLWTLQLLGKAASNTQHNYPDNGDGSNASQNWAGGGGPTPTPHDGDPNLYLMDWPPDSTTAVFDFWFKPAAQGGLGLDSSRFRYWNMDNEPEVWNSTHDDVVKDTIPVETYLAKYFAVAKLARQRFPGIKIVGPVFTNEWQWWNWNNHFVGGIPWMEYFIMRVAQEQAASGLRLLDVLDFHFYQNANSNAADEHNVTQLHRIWYDTTYDWPWANGSKAYPSGWDESRKKQYIFKRCEDWFTQYLGANHGVTISMTETGISGINIDGSLATVWYGSQLGTFADHGVEIFTPWYWNYGQWETLHLFSKNAKAIRVESTSDLDTTVSAYSSVNATGDSCTVILINRDNAATQTAHVTLAHFTPNAAAHNVLELSSLPTGSETFVSETNNALKKKTVTPAGNAFSLDLPAYSVTAVLLKGTSDVAVRMGIPAVKVNGAIKGGKAEWFDVRGRRVAALDGVAIDKVRNMSAGGVWLVKEGERVRKVVVEKE
ncbi:MAG TPA: glycoside hydrolase family 44 protein [Chitinivibrionales bacterium]|nr:glycoside hydrolase family 44 protein [Chitinivibrionales bacterium]